MKALATWLLALSLGVTACDHYPRDIDGTRDRIESRQIVRVGLAGNLDERNRRMVGAYLARITAVTHASPRLVNGSTEELLAALEADQLDLVIGEIAEDSPWIAKVTVIDPLGRRGVGDRLLGLSPIARNGENRWIMLLERLARDQRAAT